MQTKKRKKLWSLAKWKQEAKKVFQRWVRLRDANDEGFIQCCSCGRLYHWKNSNGGHFIPAEWLSTCFDPRNCHGQCIHCNKGLQGNTDSYWVFMEKKYGRKVVDELVANKHKNIKLTIYDYQEIIEEYTDKCIGLEMQKGLQ